MSVADRLFFKLISAALGDHAEDGQGLAEYGLILALVAVLCVAALTSLQGGISNTLNAVTAKL
jgi:pilus assembly protein Flp/PilA